MARPAQPLDPERRARLLGEARLAFAAHGFRAAGLAPILRRADFPRSSFYHYFGTKERLLDEAVADGLHELAGLVEIPTVAELDESSFWPSLTRLVATLSEAAVGAMYHLGDLPECPSLDAFRGMVVAWTTSAVARGLELGLLDPLIPSQMHAELAYTVASLIDRWAVRGAIGPETAQELARTVLPRMLGAPRGPGERSRPVPTNQEAP